MGSRPTFEFDCRQKKAQAFFVDANSALLPEKLYLFVRYCARNSYANELGMCLVIMQFEMWKLGFLLVFRYFDTVFMTERQVCGELLPN